MGALVVWAVVCGLLCALLHPARRLERRFPKPAVPAAAAVLSFALYVTLYHEELGSWYDSYPYFSGDRGISIVEDVMSIAHFRNALFGIAIAVLAWLWLEKRGVGGSTEDGASKEDEHKKSKLRGAMEILSAEIYLALLVVVALVAVITAEFPRLLDNVRIGIGAGVLTVEPADVRKNGGSGTLGYSAEGQTTEERVDLTTLDQLSWVVSDQSSPTLMRRDAGRVCALAREDG